MEEPQQPPPRGGDAESEGDRRLANIVLLVFFVLLVGGGIWLANALFEQRRLDDCLAPQLRAGRGPGALIGRWLSISQIRHGPPGPPVSLPLNMAPGWFPSPRKQLETIF